MSNDSKSTLSRINQISLGPFERRALPWMASRLPRWIVPDHLTFLGQFAALFIGASYWLTNSSLDWLWAANAGLIIHWAADSLDGTLARVRHIERNRYGFFIDHYSDAIAVFLMVIGLGLSPLMELPIALLLIIAYYAMMILVYLVSLARDVFKISFAGLGPTEIRLFMIIANTVVWAKQNPLITIGNSQWTLFSLIGAITLTILLSFFIIFGEIERRKLSRLDPPPKPGVKEAESSRAAADATK